MTDEKRMTQVKAMRVVSIVLMALAAGLWAWIVYKMIDLLR